jgi:hypothetical protein
LLLVLPKTLTHQALDTVSANGLFHMLARNGQAKSRKRFLVILPKHREIVITHSNGFFKNALELFWPNQPLVPSKSPRLPADWYAPVNDGLDAQALTAFRTTGVQYLATTPGAHTCTKTVGTLTLDVTGLKWSLHGRYRYLIC